MAFTDTPDPIIASLTDEGRTSFARAVLGEISFVLKGFAVGRDGYDMANPVKIIPINGSLTDLIDQFFPAPGTRKAYESIEKPTDKTLVVSCRLASDEAVSGLGEIGLWAEIIHSAVSPLEVGTEFLMAAAHFGLQTKTLRQAVVYRFIIQF
jgi:hypothetical protein